MTTLASANRATPYIFALPAIVVLAVGLVYPIGYMLYASFLDWSPSQRIGQADWVGWRNYLGLLTDPNFHESFWVTITFASVVVSVEMVLGVARLAEARVVMTALSLASSKPVPLP